MTSTTLRSPVLNLEINGKPSTKLLVGWVAFAIASVLVLGYLFVIVLPGVVGFETTVLIGVFLAVINGGDST